MRQSSSSDQSAVSDLRQSDFVAICITLNVQDESVLVWIVLDDVVIHVH